MTDPVGSGSEHGRDDIHALTDEAFWDDVWSDTALPALVSDQIRWQAALSDVLRRFLPPAVGEDVFEIGCAPGRWLVWLNRVYGLTAFGCDLSRKAAAMTRANLEMNDGATPFRWTVSDWGGPAGMRRYAVC
jgi:SAM-dependent methyltransferase